MIALKRPWWMAHEAATGILVDGEVVEYLRSLPNFSAHRQGLRNLIREVRSHVLTYPIGERNTDLRLLFHEPHVPGPIGHIETLIATTDRDFLRVPGLRVLLLDRLSLAVVADRRPARRGRFREKYNK